jgi:transposase
MVGRDLRQDKPEIWFAPPPWKEAHPQRQVIEQRLPADHLARRIDAQVNQLDLQGLIGTYTGHGTPPLRPDLMLKIALYEMACGKPSPVEWCRDARDCDTVQWLGRGIQPSRTACYDFWYRVAPFFDGWNRQVLGTAIEQHFTSAEREAQDGTTIAACASRHRLLNAKTLARRCQELDQQLAADQQSAATGEPQPPRRWMSRHPRTRRAQRDQYQRASERMDQLQAQNQQRRACHRQKPEKIVVSVSDPQAACSRDKLHVFRPLYNAQFSRDLDSPFILAYDVFDHSHDVGTIAPLAERSLEFTGRKPRILLADATYASLLELATCAWHGITLYAPVGENDFSAGLERKPQSNQFTQLPKAAFTWHDEDQTYTCPQGHRLELESQGWVTRQGDQRLRTFRFRCSPQHCCGCSLAATCTPRPEEGRTVTRLEHEELLDELRTRMKTPQAQALYRLRCQTVELAFADLKEHRSLRRFTSRGLAMAKAQVGAIVLIHNLLALHALENQSLAAPPLRILEKMNC